MNSTIDYRFIIPAIIGTLAIVYASSLPDLTIVSTDRSMDRLVSNLAHIPAFTVLSLFWLKSFARARDRRIEVLVLIGLTIFAVTDEWHQSTIPGRTAALSDLMLDLTGIALGFVWHRFEFWGRS